MKILQRQLSILLCSFMFFGTWLLLFVWFYVTMKCYVASFQRQGEENLKCGWGTVRDESLKSGIKKKVELSNRRMCKLEIRKGLYCGCIRKCLYDTCMEFLIQEEFNTGLCFSSFLKAVWCCSISFSGSSSVFRRYFHRDNWRQKSLRENDCQCFLSMVFTNHFLGHCRGYIKG